jgi:SSS family solute:Na+ symporter
MRKLPEELPDFMHFITVPGFMMMAVYLLIACLVIQISISIVSPAGESERASKLYWKTPLEPLKDKGWPLFGNYKFLSVLLIVVMGVLYYIFR